VDVFRQNLNAGFGSGFLSSARIAVAATTAAPAANSERRETGMARLRMNRPPSIYRLRSYLTRERPPMLFADPLLVLLAAGADPMAVTESGGPTWEQHTGATVKLLKAAAGAG
jgi:hypothetical protein